MNVPSFYPNRFINLTPSGADVTVPDGVEFIRIGGTGDVAIEDYGGNSITLTGFSANDYLLPIPRKIKLTGTTVSQIVGFYHAL